MVENGSVVVPKDSNNNVKLTYTSSSSSLGAGASSDATTLNTQGLPAGTTRYVYVIVSIVELLNDVDFEGTFGWDLAKGEALTTNTTGGSQSIVIDTTNTALYNKSAMQNFQLVLNVEDTEPDYPIIEEKCFVGWYLDSGYKNEAVFPLIPTADTKLYPKHETATSDLTYDTYDESWGTEECRVGYWNAYSGSATNLVIADAHRFGSSDIRLVSEINPAFISENISENTSIEKITIPGSITHISSYVRFNNCSNLTQLEVAKSNKVYFSETNCIIERKNKRLSFGIKTSIIPNSVEIIGYLSFYGCANITTITIPANVKEIESSAFEGCSGLTNVSIPNSVESIEDKAFNGCTGLTSITIPNSVVSIGNSAFDGTHLSDIVIPSSVTSIGKQAFNGSYINSITVDSSNAVYKSENNCIIQKSNNTLILGCRNSVIPSYVKTIADYAFYGCSGLKSITIPDSVTSIGNYAFYRCVNVTNVVLPDNLLTIGNYAFNYCSNLTSVVIGSGVKKVGSNAFSSCSKLTSATFKTTTGWTVTTSSTATTGTSVTISTTDFAANATLLKTTHVSKYWNRA